MQVDAGGLQVGVSQQHLNRGQIGAVLQQVGGKAVTQHMGTDVLLEASVPRGFGAGVPDGFVGQVLALTAWFAWKEPCPGLLPSPVFTQCFEESGTERHIAIFTTLAFANVDDHAFAVDVLDA